MSAWLVSDESLTLTRNALVVHLGIPNKFADKMVKGWAKLNRYSLGCRYGDKRPKAFHFTHLADIRTPMQAFKSIGCLSYQCNEGVPERDMPEEWFSLKGVEEAFRDKFELNPNTPEYNKALWD